MVLESLSNVVEDSLIHDMQNLPLADESTDIVNNKDIVIYAWIISDDMKPSTRFLTMLRCLWQGSCLIGFSHTNIFIVHLMI